MIDVHFVLGFLGAGKTTFIKSYLQRIPDLSRVQLIVNDFGQERFDSELLKADGADAVEISQGCLCCGLMESFRQVIIDNADRTDIDRIIIEPSGIFIPDDVLQLFKAPAMASKLRLRPIVKIINTALFIEKDLTRLPFIIKQIRCSGVVVLNRIPGIEDSDVNMLKGKLRLIKPSLVIIEEPGVGEIFDIFGLTDGSADLLESDADGETDSDPTEHPYYSIRVKEGLEFSNEQSLQIWIKGQGHQLVRAKGAALVNGQKVLVHYTAGALDTDVSPETIDIGITLIFEKPEFKRNFKE
jgi:G3E family GTPase